MGSVLLYALVAAFTVSSLSLVGVIGFVLEDKSLKKISIFFVALSTGALLGGAFLHLLPEATSKDSSLNVYLSILLGIVLFYLLEKILKWHHGHIENKSDIHTFTYMNMVGDGVHNFIDGLVIVSAFSVSFEVGLATTLAVALHEIPQELGDFGVLIHGGFSKYRAIFWNFITAVTAVAGVLIGYWLIDKVNNIALFFVPFAAGGFIYIAMSDLIPELHKEKSLKKSMVYLAIVILGLVFMYFTKVMFE